MDWLMVAFLVLVGGVLVWSVVDRCRRPWAYGRWFVRRRDVPTRAGTSDPGGQLGLDVGGSSGDSST